MGIITGWGKLARMSKDCFYAGLLPENCPMVVHLKDQPHTTPLDLLRALLEQEENDALTHTRYPLSTSSRPSHPQKTMERYHQQPATEKRNDGYTVCPAQLDAAQVEAAPEADAPTFDDTVDALESRYNDGFLIPPKLLRLANPRVAIASTTRKKVTWCQCKETLSPELQELSDQQDREQEEWKEKIFKPQGGVGVKGGHAPTPLVGASLAPPPGARGPHPVDDVSAGGSPYKYRNEDTLSRWLGPENLGWGYPGWRPNPGVG